MRGKHLTGDDRGLGAVPVFRGQLVTCESGDRRVTRTEHDGSITVLVDRFEGKRLNSPNDLVVKSDDTIWLTDPDYDILLPGADDRCHWTPTTWLVKCYWVDSSEGRLRYGTEASA